MKDFIKGRLSKLLFVLFIPMLLFMLAPQKVVNAADVSNNISSLTVSSSEITDGGQTTVKFTFDEHAQKIKAGDTLEVTWPSSGTIHGTGFKKTIKLTIDGTYVGDMVITDGSAKVTFNDGITGLENIRGWGEFEIEGHNNTATDKEHVGTFTIVSGDKSVELSVKKMATGVNSAPFYLKAGDMHADDPEHILWTLTINAMNLEVDGDVRVEDEVQGGHKLVTDSFSITTTGAKPGYFGGDTAIEDFKAAFPGSTFTVDASGKITVTIPKDLINKTGVLIFYRTKVENDAQKEFKNNTKVWYHVKGETAVVAKEVNASVANINANGGVDGDQSTPSIPTTTTVATTTTEAPTTTVATTEAPVVTTSAPVVTEAPVVTTSAPVSTEAPVVTTVAPVSTEAPVVTTSAPVVTEAPTTTTTTTEAPTTTTATTVTEASTTSTEATTEAPRSRVRRRRALLAETEQPTLTPEAEVRATVVETLAPSETPAPTADSNAVEDKVVTPETNAKATETRVLATPLAAKSEQTADKDAKQEKNPSPTPVAQGTPTAAEEELPNTGTSMGTLYLILSAVFLSGGAFVFAKSKK